MNKLPIIKKGYVGGMDFHESSSANSFALLMIFFVGIGIFFILLFLRLFQLTIVKGNYYRQLAEDNRIREEVIEPQRGTLIDRKGFVIAQSTPADINSQAERYQSNRHYEDPEAFAHIIGYRQLANADDIKNDNCLTKLKSGDKVGKKGVEALFDCALRGKPGKKMVEVDARGKYLQTLNVLPPENGQTVQLSIDQELQKVAYEQIQGKRAVVVALKPNTGEVLVLASAPSYNPQAFEDQNNDLISQYFTDTSKPLFNRATEGVYPPGSTFKLVLAAGALEDKVVDPNFIVDDKGFLMAGALRFGNWYYLEYGKTEGPVDMVKAIRRSNDTYFYTIGQKMGPEKIKQWAEKFGYEKRTGLGIDESEGTVPSPFWKEDVLKEKWYLGDTYNFSIGQGYMLATPMQVAQEASVFASNGQLCSPTLLKTRSESGDPTVQQYAQPKCTKLPISQKTLDIIHEGMKQACSTGGTGWPFFDFKVNDASSSALVRENPSASRSAKLVKRPITVACKTGTAESQAASGVPHAWFTAYAPADHPEIVIAVLVEESGQGADVAAPIAKAVLTSYFERLE